MRYQAPYKFKQRCREWIIIGAFTIACLIIMVHQRNHMKKGGPCGRDVLWIPEVGKSFSQNLLFNRQ